MMTTKTTCLISPSEQIAIHKRTSFPWQHTIEIATIICLSVLASCSQAQANKKVIKTAGCIATEFQGSANTSFCVQICLHLTRSGPWASKKGQVVRPHRTRAWPFHHSSTRTYHSCSCLSSSTCFNPIKCSEILCMHAVPIFCQIAVRHSGTAGNAWYCSWPVPQGRMEQDSGSGAACIPLESQGPPHTRQHLR